MNLNKKVSLLLLVLISHTLWGQNDSSPKWLNNDSIKYSVVLAAEPGSGGLLFSKYLILVNLNTEHSNTLRKIQWSTWQTLLNNDTTDWAANILLYCIYKKDAAVFHVVIQNRNDWIGRNKTNDISEWREFFKKKRNKKQY